MAWIRLSDDYNDHPKFDQLSDGAFRLWHQAMGFCRKFKTDGLIPHVTVKGFKAFSRARAKELTTPWREGENPLWLDVDGFGVKVHDYLEWNLSKDEESKEADGAAKRMRRLRSERRSVLGSPEQLGERSPDVPGRESVRSSFPERERERKPFALVEDDTATRAGWLVNRYGELFIQHRFGARHKARPNLDWQEACELVRLWPDARLEKLAALVLTTDEEWIAKTDRSFKIFALKATWADAALSAWEAEQAARA